MRLCVAFPPVRTNHPAESGPAAIELARRRGSYGIDAPYFLPVPALLILANLVNGVISKSLWPFLAASLIIGCTAFGLYASRRGKFVVWARLFRQLDLRGDERILDLGWCPRGRKAENGTIGARYKPKETPNADYVQRTEWNVRDSDGTVVFSIAQVLTGG